MPNWEFAGGYIDEGISGVTTKKREKFNEMIDDALSGMFDLIVTKEVSRFARNTRGNKLAHSTMANIIKNPKYMGCYVGNKELAEIRSILTLAAECLDDDELNAGDKVVKTLLKNVSHTGQTSDQICPKKLNKGVMALNTR